MKKIFAFIVALGFVFALSACDNIEIVPDEIGVVYEDFRYEDDSTFVVTVFITNGFDSAEYISSMDFGIYIAGEETAIAEANFEIDETIPANDYIELDLVFDGFYLYFSETQFETLDIEFTDLELLFWIIED